MNDQPIPSQDDKIVAALAHAAAVLPLWGLLVSILIWVTQREKSEYIRQQSMQALAWQVLQIWIFLGGMVLYVSSFSLVFGSIFLLQEVPSDAPPPGFFVPVCVFGLIFLSFFVTIVVALYAAVRNLQGHPFIYPIVGPRVQNYLTR